MILAVDPGLTGAIALVNGNSVENLWDMPTMAAIYGKGNIINSYKLSQIFDEVGKAWPCSDTRLVYIEQVSAMPGQGVSSMFKFGCGFGMLQGVAAANDFAMEFVSPQKWKKHCGLLRRDKDAARTLAIQKYPANTELLKRKKDIGRADALMIAHYAKSLNN